MDAHLAQDLQPERSSHALAVPTPRVTGPRRPHWQNYTAFVLSGGGARGALQVGALRALLERGEHADIVVGTSAGALNGALFARTPSLAGVEHLAAAWREVNPALVLLGREVPPGRPPQTLMGLLFFAMARRVTGGQPSLYGDSGLRQIVQQHLGETTFEQLALPLYVITTDLTNSRRAIFTSGPLLPAVMASTAIPGIFPPVPIGENIYVDGGALDNCSLDTALRAGARRLFVVDVGSNTSGDRLLRPEALVTHTGRHGHRSTSLPLATVLERTSQAMNRYHLDRALERVPRGIETHVLRLTTRSTGGSLGFGNASDLIEEGYAATTAYLDAALSTHQSVATISVPSTQPPPVRSLTDA